LIKKLDDGSILLDVAAGLGGEAAADYAAEIARSRLAGINQVRWGEEEQQLEALLAEAMISLLVAETDLETKAKSLVEAALDSGGKDNITIVIAERS
jgi:hypothetical protein